MTFIKIYNKKIIFIKQPVIYVFLSHYKGCSDLQTFNFLIFPILGDDFGLPGSGSVDSNKSGSNPDTESTTLVKKGIFFK
jgi:hypothetical protein